MSKRNVEVRHRDQAYAEKYRTSIWREENDDPNPFVETGLYCHGYSLEELVDKINYPDMVFLMIKGELPTADQAQFLRRLFVAFSHPGLRNEATRAAILAGVGKTLSSHVLPIGMLVYGGEKTGAGDVESSMRFFRKNSKKEVGEVAHSSSSLPGFGSYYGSKDKMAETICNWLQLCEMDTPHLFWANRFAEALHKNNPDTGLTKAGVAAAAFCDLGILPRYGIGLLQLISAPGVLAQGMEHANKQPTVLPFVPDEQYELADEQ